MLKVGADPELFCFDTNKKSFISAHTFFPGTKDTPFPVEDGALQLDGLAAELNINPVNNSKDFVKVLTSVMNTARKYLPEGVQLVATPSVIFDNEYYASIPDTNKQMGCTPDYNAWLYGGQNDIPDVLVPSLRAAGGHIHLGPEGFSDLPEDVQYMRQVTLVKQLDCIVGLQCMLWDPPNERKNIYGKAGAYRPKPYGVEYRTPSNYWLSSEEKMRQVFELTQKAHEDVEKGKIYYLLLQGYDFQEIINTDNKILAEEAFHAVLAA